MRSFPVLFRQAGQTQAKLLHEVLAGVLGLLTLLLLLPLLLAPASIITLGLGVALGYKGPDYIKGLLEGGGQG